MCRWIKLAESLPDWQWFDDANMVKAWVYMLIKAASRDHQWHGITIERGQLVTSVSALAEELMLSSKQVRTILERLEKTGEIGKQSNNKYTIITICNYARYQDRPEEGLQLSGQTNGEQGANKGQTKGNTIRIEEYKNIYNNTYAASGSAEGDTPTYDNPSIDDIAAAARRLYQLYPTKDVIRGRRVNKSKKDLDKIVSMLKSGRHTEESLTSTINQYLEDRKQDGFIKDLKTFLNNLPDYSDLDVTPAAETRATNNDYQC